MYSVWKRPSGRPRRGQALPQHAIASEPTAATASGQQTEARKVAATMHDEPQWV